MSLDLQKLRHDRRRGTFEPVRQRPDNVNWRFSATCVDRVDAPRDYESPIERLQTQEQEIVGPRTVGKNVQGKRFLDTDATTGIRPRSHVLQVQTIEEVHAVPVQKLETPFARRCRGQRCQQSDHLNETDAKVRVCFYIIGY